MNSGAGFRDGSDGRHSPEIDLMDTTIQRLYGLGLKLEYCLTLLDESPEQARDGLDAAVNEVGQLIEPLRRRIQRLRAPRRLESRNED
jgi:signal transduction histidine kinase